MTKKVRTFLFRISAIMICGMFLIPGIGNNLLAQAIEPPLSEKQPQPLQAGTDIYSFNGNLNWQKSYFPGLQSAKLETYTETQLQLEFRNIDMLNANLGFGYKVFSTVFMNGFFEGFGLSGIGAGPLLRYYLLENSRWQPFLQSSILGGYNLTLTDGPRIANNDGFSFRSSLKAGFGYKFSNSFGLFIETGPSWEYSPQLQLDSRALLFNIGIELHRLTGSILHAPSSAKRKLAFVRKGTFLTGFNFSLGNGSREKFNQDLAQEVTGISFEVDGLYFVSEHVGVGPIFAYGFSYRDLYNVIYPPRDIDERRYYWVTGIKAGYFIPINKVLDGGSYLFLEGGALVQYSSFMQESGFDSDDSQFGYKIGTGILIPVGKQLALNTKLGFQSFRREYKFVDKQNEPMNETRWLKEVALSVGLKVGF